MKKHASSFLIFILFIILILAGCGNTAASNKWLTEDETEVPEQPQIDTEKPGSTDIEEGTAAPKQPPSLEILFTTDDGSSVRIQTFTLGFEWNYINEDGTGGGILADSPPPHEIEYDDDRTINLNGSGGEIEFHFSDNYPPDSLSAERIDAVFLFSNEEDVYKNYETIILIDNRLRVNSEGTDYIYALSAIWGEGGRSTECTIDRSTGRVTYSFRVNN